MIVLVLNSGSSSLKFQVIDTDLEAIEKNADKTLAQGVIERIGSEALINLRAEGQPPSRSTAPLRDHRAALDKVLRWLVSPDSNVPGVASVGDIAAVGHRVVHGGEKFTKSVVIDDAVVDQIEDCIDLAPLHNPANLKGIYAAREILGQGVPQVAVFDTSFHSTMPDTSYLYAIPYQLYVRHKVRRYGFHGTSHRYVAYRYRIITGKSYDETNIITVHLGNGCSACAIQKGSSINTSMGLTPLEGLVMGTRGGNIDPSILEFLHHKEGFSLDQLDALLNKQSGLLGISGLTNDMRDLLEEERLHQDRRARLAIDIFCLRVKHYIGSYLAQMNGADAIVFTGGIGENSADVRRGIVARLGVLGIPPLPDEDVEMTGDGRLNSSGDAILRVEAREDLVIASETAALIR